MSFGTDLIRKIKKNMPGITEVLLKHFLNFPKLRLTENIVK